MKHEWRRHEKPVYLPNNRPEFRNIPEFSFFTLKGSGNPNHEHFSEYISVLYSLSYAIKMNLKKNPLLADSYDYTVYPLEGIWDITREAKQENKKVLDKNDLVFTLMIRQPDFVTPAIAQKILGVVSKTKPHPLLNQVNFEKIREGSCIQMLHIGSYDKEAETFRIMEDYAASVNKTRISKNHREIYLSDTRKVKAEKLKTVLRFRVK